MWFWETRRLPKDVRQFRGEKNPLFAIIQKSKESGQPVDSDQRGFVRFFGKRECE